MPPELHLLVVFLCCYRYRPCFRTFSTTACMSNAFRIMPCRRNGVRRTRPDFLNLNSSTTSPLFLINSAKIVLPNPHTPTQPLW